MSRWHDAAVALIANIDASLPAGADLAARRRALRGKGYPAHQGTAWGRIMWGRAVRAYLASHGADAEARRAVAPIPDEVVNAPLRGTTTLWKHPHPDSVRAR